MKTTLQLFLFLFSGLLFAQITLEHTYDEGYGITRINLENSGEKYYLYNYATKEVMLYNSDHTIWKKILLPVVSSSPQYFSSVNINHLSENKINADANLEIVYTNIYSDENGFHSESRVISENGTTLFTILDANTLYISEIYGSSNKLIVDFKPSQDRTDIYNLPNFNLEHSYSKGKATRVLLENSGEKYCLLNEKDGVAEIYNSNHSLWKTVNLPLPTEGLFPDYYYISFVSENQINTEEQLEIGYHYTYYPLNSSKSTFEGRIVNELGEVLLTIPNDPEMIVSQLNGLPNKLIAYTFDDDNKYNTNVYDLPSFSLEKTYPSHMTRTLLEVSGEKYFSTYPTNQSIDIFNSNHTLWKSIKPNIPLNNKLHVVNHFSENKINSDNLLELSFTYSNDNQYESKIINENGLDLLTVMGANSIYLSEMPGLENKIIANGTQGTVYRLNGNLEVSNFNTASKVLIAPNPAKSFISLNSLGAPIKEATIYNFNGALVWKENAQNITKINVEDLPIGIYIVNLTDFNNKKSTHKITILH